MYSCCVNIFVLLSQGYIQGGGGGLGFPPRNLMKIFLLKNELKFNGLKHSSAHFLLKNLN